MKRPYRWLAGLVLAVIFVGVPVASTAATYYWDSGRIITVEPRMNIIPNTDVYFQRTAPGYDLYRYGNRWYVVDNGNWYQSRTWEGPYVSLSYAGVPEEVTMIPENYRRYWNAEYGNSAPTGSYASPRTFGQKPKMTRITSTGVQYARAYAPDFDMYRYRSTWYLVDDGVWYRSDSWKGPFLTVRARRVPVEVLSVPSSYRRHWSSMASYPVRTHYWASGTTFDVQPEMTLIPNSSVYYMADQTGYGLYRYGNSWFLIDNGTWYFSNTWRGPYARVTDGSVPTAVLTIPVMYRREWYVPED